MPIGFHVTETHRFDCFFLAFFEALPKVAENVLGNGCGHDWTSRRKDDTHDRDSVQQYIAGHGNTNVFYSTFTRVGVQAMVGQSNRQRDRQIRSKSGQKLELQIPGPPRKGYHRTFFAQENCSKRVNPGLPIRARHVSTNFVQMIGAQFSLPRHGALTRCFSSTLAVTRNTKEVFSKS